MTLPFNTTHRHFVQSVVHQVHHVQRHTMPNSHFVVSGESPIESQVGTNQAQVGTNGGQVGTNRYQVGANRGEVGANWHQKSNISNVFNTSVLAMRFFNPLNYFFY